MLDHKSTYLKMCSYVNFYEKFGGLNTPRMHGGINTARMLGGLAIKKESINHKGKLKERTFFEINCDEKKTSFSAEEENS